MSWLKWVLGIAFGLFALICLVVGGLTLLGASVADESVPPAAEERSGGGSQGAESAPVAVSLGAEHTNPVGFAFQPPAGWQVREPNVTDQGVGAVLIIPPDTAPDTAEFQIALFIRPTELLAQELPSDEITLDAIAEYTQNDTLDEYGDVWSEPRKTTIGGEEAVAFDMDATVGRAEARGRIVAALVNNRQQYFNAVLIGPEDQWQDGAIADAVLGTVRFTGGAGQ